MALNYLPIQRKLIGFIFLTTLTVLLGSYLVLFVYESRSSEQTTVQGLKTMADIIAGNSTAALIYDDPKLAHEIISGLRAEPDITEAALFDKQGKLYAVYPAGRPASAFPATPGSDGAEFSLRALVLFHPVVQGNMRVGTLFIRSDLGAMYRRLSIYGWVLIGVLVGAVVLAFFLSNFLQRKISQPILSLAETAKIVSEQKDYSIRATKQSGDELGFVTEAFNAMLERIQLSHAALRDSELQMRLMTDNASVFLCQIDPEHRFKFANRAYARRYGLEPLAVVGRHVSEVIGPHAYEAVRDRMVLAFSGMRQEFETELPYATLGRRWVHIVYEPENGEDGRVAGVVSVISDMTERQQAAKELERARDEAINASRAKDDFLAALSHELRTPLNPILLLATDAVNNPEFPPQVRADFEMVRKNVELEARLIDDLLDLTRIISGKLILEYQSIDVHAVLQDALDTIRAELTLKGIELVSELAPGNPVLRGDPVRLQQVFWNVLKNAVKFTPERGKITVATKVSDDRKTLAIKVTDTGIGISPDELDRVFEAFSQGDHAKGAGGSHRFGGLGLGLAISRKMIELHSGRIYAESDGRNLGSTFAIELPLLSLGGEEKRGSGIAPQAPPSRTPEAVAGPGASPSILLVEDHAPTRLVLEHLLRRRNFHVFACASVEQARHIAQEQKIDFVISDIGLPDGNGYELMAELQQRYRLKGIALTGYGMERDVVRSHATGFVVHLTKPVSMQALDAAIAAVGSWSV
jgi:PAS domain S-box-containing protein